MKKSSPAIKKEDRCVRCKDEEMEKYMPTDCRCTNCDNWFHWDCVKDDPGYDDWSHCPLCPGSIYK